MGSRDGLDAVEKNKDPTLSRRGNEPSVVSLVAVQQDCTCANIKSSQFFLGGGGGSGLEKKVLQYLTRNYRT
jgi:hypothetical protein